MFEVVTPSRTFYVQVDKEEDMQDWVRALQELLKAVKPSLQVKSKQFCSLSGQAFANPILIWPRFVLVSCPDHTPEGRDGLVNEVEFLGLITGMW